jgi:hypothetical protein
LQFAIIPHAFLPNLKTNNNKERVPVGSRSGLRIVSQKANPNCDLITTCQGDVAKPVYMQLSAQTTGIHRDLDGSPAVGRAIRGCGLRTMLTA